MAVTSWKRIMGPGLVYTCTMRCIRFVVALQLIFRFRFVRICHLPFFTQVAAVFLDARCRCCCCICLCCHSFAHTHSHTKNPTCPEQENRNEPRNGLFSFSRRHFLRSPDVTLTLASGRNRAGCFANASVIRRQSAAYR